MADYPIMPVGTSDFIADTEHLSHEEIGLYWRMCMQLWRAPNQRFPNDDAWLVRKFRAEPGMIRALVTEFFRSDGNWIRHKRVDREFERISQYGKKQSDRAKSRWNKGKDTSRGNATLNLNSNKVEKELFGNTGDTSEESSLNVTVRQRGTNALTLTQSNGHDLDAEFEEWWQLYPRKVGKKACKPKYVAARRKDGVTAEQMRAGLQAYIATKPHDRPWCYPVTWLNQGRWADEPEPTPLSEAQAWLERQE